MSNGASLINHDEHKLDQDISAAESTGRSTGFSQPTLTPRNAHLKSSNSDTISSHSDIPMLSPRSNAYDRLETGMGPPRGTKKRFGWKKFAIGAVVLIGLVYIFGPRERRQMWSGGNDVPNSTYEDIIDTAPLPPPPAATTTTTTTDVLTAVKSFETDPDPSKTTQCTSAYAGTARLVQYALMIDAGSTGSRIHIYKFNNCGPAPTYEYEVFKMIQPGLSSFSGRPLDAAKSLDVLLDEAVRVVPESLRKCTPVAVKATAGLRLLPGSQAKDILDAVENRLKTEYSFKLQEKDGVVIMDGKDEGVYAWITANYLLGVIDSPGNTYAVLDLGGASTQIVFEPMFAQSDTGLEEGEHKYDLTFGGKKHVLYQHSYLGYGLMRARRHVHQLVDFMASIRSPEEYTSAVIANPCLARGTRRAVEVEDERTKVKRNVTMEGETVGSFEACTRVVELVMAKDAICEMKPCSFNGVYQPSLLDSFPTGKVLLLSYFFDRIDPLLPVSSLNIGKIASLATSVCKGRNEWLGVWGADAALMAELEDRPEWCLDLTFMHSLLRLGYEFEDTRDVLIGKKIQDTELGWCLGATIAMVAGELTCRI